MRRIAALALISYSVLFGQMNKSDFMKEFGYLGEKKNNSFVNDYVKSSFKGDDYMSKQEFFTAKQTVEKIQDKYKKPRTFLLYFTSSSVPLHTMKNILFQTGLLQEDGFDIYTKQYLIGVPEHFEDYMVKLKKYINETPDRVRKRVVNNVGIKIDPTLFEFFHIKKVPAVVLAKCTGKNPGVKNCEFDYLMRGDASLVEFFSRAKEDNKKYTPYYESLLSHNF